jgi:Aspartyl protease
MSSGNPHRQALEGARTMSRTICDTSLGGVFLVALAAIGVIGPSARADEPSPAQVLLQKGLVRAGVAYIFMDEADLRNRVAEIGKRFAEWKREYAGLDERFEALSRLRLQHQEVMKKMRAIENGSRPGRQEFRPRPFGNDGPHGPNSVPPPPDSGPFHPGSGPPPPPPDGMDGFRPGPIEDLMRQIPVADPRRQYGILNAERAALAAEIVLKQVFSEDISRRLEAQLREIEERRLEAVALDKQIRSRYDALASDLRVKQAIATLNESSASKLSLGQLEDDSNDLSALASAIAESRQGMLKRLAQLELRGIARLSGLVGAADTLVQEIGVNAGRMQTLEREAASRTHLLAEQSKQRTILAERLRQASDSSERGRIATELRAKETRAGALLTEGSHSRESLAEVIQSLASQREDYLRIVKALKDAIDDADHERGTANTDSTTKNATKAPSGDERRLDPIGTMEPFKVRLREFEKTIHSEHVAIDADKTIRWIDATLNGKSLKLMIDLGVKEIRLSAPAASAVGAHPADGYPAVDIVTVDGRTIPTRPARLETIQVGPFTRHNVDCLVLAESAGECPSVLGGEFFDQFSTRIDADAGTAVLTQVQVKPILHSSKTAAARSTGSTKTKRTAPATGRSPAS